MSKMYRRREYLTHQALLTAPDIWAAREAVASTAIEHPEWDMDEMKTWDEWEQQRPGPAA